MYKYYIVFIIIILGIVFYKSYKPKKSIVLSNTNQTIQAWIYPGAPSCDAMSEIADGRMIDVLKPEYFTVNSAGDILLLTESEFGCNGYSETNLNKIKQYSSQQYVLVSSNHIDMRVLFSNDDKTNQAINTLTDFVNHNQLTGVEIDFEDFSSWTVTDYKNYKEFVKNLSDKLHTNSKMLMIDGPPLNSTTQKDYLWKYSDFNQLPVDYIVVMVYDNQYDHGKGSFISPNSWVESVVTYVKQQVDSSKLVIGIPSYGYHTNTNGQIILDTHFQSQKYSGYDTAKKSKESFEYSWYDKNNFYVVQNSDSISDKINFIKTLGINNFSIWHLGGNPWFN